MRPKPTAGYSGTPLLKKLGIKAGMRVCLVGAPETFDGLLGPLPEDVTTLSRLGKDLDYIHVFAKDQRELARRLPSCVKGLAKDGSLWISWPKKSSPLAVDLTGEEVRGAGRRAGLVDIKVCAVDEDWSGHKFCYRREDR